MTISEFTRSEFKKRSDYVLGVSYGQKTVKGKKTKQKSIIYYVNKKKCLYQIPPDQIIKQDVLINNKKITTDVVECDIKCAFTDGVSPWNDWQTSAPSNRGTFNPIKGGIEVSNYSDRPLSSGTLGFVAQDKDDLSLVGVSASHVLLSDSFYTADRDPLKGVFYDSYLPAGHDVVQPIAPTPEASATPQPTPEATTAPPSPTSTPMPTPHPTATNRLGNKIGIVRRYNPLKNNLGSSFKNECDASLIALEENTVSPSISWQQEGLNTITSAPSFASTSEIDAIISNTSSELLSSGKTTGAKGEGNVKLKPVSTSLNANLIYRLQNVPTFIQVNNCFTFKANDGANDIYFPVAEGDSGSAVIAEINGEHKIIGMVIGMIVNSGNNKVEEAICSRIDKISSELNIKAWDGSNVGSTYSKNEEGEYFILQGKPWSNQKTVNFTAKEYWQAGLVDCREYSSMPTPTPSATPAPTPIPGGHLTLEGDAYYPSIDFFGCAYNNPRYMPGASGGLEFSPRYGRGSGHNNKGFPTGMNHNNPDHNQGQFEFRGNIICWLNVNTMNGMTMSWRLGNYKQADYLAKHIWGSAIKYGWGYYSPCSDRYAYTTSSSSSDLSKNWKVCKSAAPIFRGTNSIALRKDGRYIYEISPLAMLADCTRDAYRNIGAYHGKSINSSGIFSITNSNTIWQRPPFNYDAYYQVGKTAFDGSNNTCMARWVYKSTPGATPDSAWAGWVVINLNTLVSLAPFDHHNADGNGPGGRFGALYDRHHKGVVGGNNFFAIHGRTAPNTFWHNGVVHIVGRWYNNYKNWSNGRYSGGWMPWARQISLSRAYLPLPFRDNIHTFGAQISATPQDQRSSFLAIQSESRSGMPDIFTIYDMSNITSPRHKITFQIPWKNSNLVPTNEKILRVTRGMCIDAQSSSSVSLYVIVFAFNAIRNQFGNAILNINALTGQIMSETFEPSASGQQVTIIDRPSGFVRFGETISANGSGRVAVGCNASYREKAGNGNSYSPSSRIVLVYKAQQGGSRTTSASSIPVPTASPTPSPSASAVVNNITVTVSGGKFLINGASQPTLTLIEGETYKFDQSDSSNSSHPLRFSTTSDGTHNSGSEYTTGVITVGSAGSSGSYTLITVNSGAPTLFYYCANHSGMGGQANTP